jgi:hypothetical protein
MPDIPVYSYEDLRKKADEFLQEHHPSGAIPIPIEEIKSVTEWTRKIRDKGISMEKNWDFSWELITEHVSKAFLVSPDVVEKRVEKDGIKKKYMK